MALAFLNNCIFRAASNGTGSFVHASAITGYQEPDDCTNPAVVDGATYRYDARSDDNSQWEVGYGVYTASTDTLTRATILSSTNGGAAVSFSAAPSVAMGGALAGDQGWAKVSSGTLSSVEFIDIPLPTSHSRFILHVDGLEMSVTSTPTPWFVFSQDGGSSWISDGVNFDSYKWQMWFEGGPVGSNMDGLALLANAASIDPISNIAIKVEIWPGSTGKNASAFSECSFVNTNDGSLKSESGAILLAEATGRVDAIRLLPAYGTGGSPVTGQEFASGQWVLLGLPDALF